MGTPVPPSKKMTAVTSQSRIRTISHSVFGAVKYRKEIIGNGMCIVHFDQQLPNMKVAGSYPILEGGSLSLVNVTLQNVHKTRGLTQILIDVFKRLEVCSQRPLVHPAATYH
mmetsp:Transcript_1044/g.2888  ORF Transcript_1044/g.2888 Transcript_1044/m.2888 type:complete len:112 (-) Transcript_1044:62-397(-)